MDFEDPSDQTHLHEHSMSFGDEFWGHVNLISCQGDFGRLMIDDRVW